MLDQGDGKSPRVHTQQDSFVSTARLLGPESPMPLQIVHGAGKICLNNALFFSHFSKRHNDTLFPPMSMAAHTGSREATAIRLPHIYQGQLNYHPPLICVIQMKLRRMRLSMVGSGGVRICIDMGWARHSSVMSKLSGTVSSLASSALS